jgi:glycosyltransferase involved in cell wall biosynthesis
VVALEAALSGVATVGTAVGYLADWAPDAAVAVEPADPSALAGAIAAALADSHRRQRLAANAREWALRHDADWTADAFSQIYAELQAGTRRN